jgi:hypothetical protein
VKNGAPIPSYSRWRRRLIAFWMPMLSLAMGARP